MASKARDFILNDPLLKPFAGDNEDEKMEKSSPVDSIGVDE